MSITTLYYAKKSLYTKSEEPQYTLQIYQEGLTKASVQECYIAQQTTYLTLENLIEWWCDELEFKAKMLEGGRTHLCAVLNKQPRTRAAK